MENPHPNKAAGRHGPRPSRRRRPPLDAAFGLILASAAVASSGAVARDLSAMTGAEIKILAQRLTNAGCYRGPIDTTPSAALQAAQKSCPDQQPILRIETGMHRARIWRIAADAQCHLLASASEDKTVRLWQMPEGRLLRTQRLPIGAGNAGKVFAVAVSPDGQLVAAGGWDAAYAAGQGMGMGMGIYLFDSAAGTSIRRLGPYRGSIRHLAFSPDGTRLAVALGTGGIRVLDVKSGAELMADRDFSDRANDVVFGPGGALYAVALDGSLRRYGPDLKRTAKIRVTSGRRPYSIALDPSGRRLALGYEDARAVDIYDAQTLKRLGTADVSGVSNGNLAAVTWSPDGSMILAGGLFAIKQGDQWRYAVRAFTPDGQRALPDSPVAGNTVHALIPCGSDVAYASGDPSFGLIDANGHVKVLGKSHSVDMRDKRGDAFMVSADATRLRFGLGMGNAQPAVFDLRQASLTLSPSPGSDLFAASIAGLDITGWLNKPAPRLHGQAIGIAPYEIARSLAALPGGNGFVLGTDWALRRFDSNGRLRWAKPVPAAAWGVNVARSGALILAAFGDGTIRWYRSRDGQELLALFIDKTNHHWIAWTPSGYYMASSGGEDLIGWHINRGFTQKPDFFSAAQFHTRFERPDIVENILDTMDEAEAVRLADARAHRQEATQPVTAALPPVIDILAPATGTRFSSAKITLTYVLRAPSRLPVDAVALLIDGHPTSIEGPGLPKSADDDKGLIETLTVALPPRDVDIGLVATSGRLASTIAHVHLTYARAATEGAAAHAMRDAEKLLAQPQ
ncbi:MAG: WD40 repeat domain-containing protein [Methylovirgula sp.]